MRKTILRKEIEEKAISKLDQSGKTESKRVPVRTPVHVVYGGAHMFSAETPEKLGRLALRSIEVNAANFAEFAKAIWLNGADSLPKEPEAIQELEFELADDPTKAKAKNPEAWFAWTVFNKTIEKLKHEPVEDYRIDFEDGYGFRSEEEEDADSIRASDELVKLVADDRSIPGCGFRIKSLQPETRKRAIRTLDLFLSNLLEKTNGTIPDGFVVTLPKVKSPVETEVLDELLSEIEENNGITAGEFDIEILIETPESIPLMKEIVAASNGRCIAAHFGAYDYTASIGIAAAHQHIRHEACNFARNMMQVSLAPLGIRLSDSVTIDMPIAVHKEENLSITQIAENRLSVHEGWRKHFNNVTHSQINGFYQSWDLHPAQLPARYAAVYAFFLETFDLQSKRLRGFLEKATQAMTTGNIFDDLASAEGLLNFFIKGVNCGAFDVAEVCQSTGITVEEFESASFAEIMKTRFEQ